jgi:hypothetical protein
MYGMEVDWNGNGKLKWKIIWNGIEMVCKWNRNEWNGINMK